MKSLIFVPKQNQDDHIEQTGDDNVGTSVKAPAILDDATFYKEVCKKKGGQVLIFITREI